MKELKQNIEEGLYFLEITATNTFNNNEQIILSENQSLYNKGYFAGYLNACKDIKFEVLDPVFDKRTTPLRFDLNLGLETKNRLIYSLESLVDEFERIDYSVSEVCEIIKSRKAKSKNNDNFGHNPDSFAN